MTSVETLPFRAVAELFQNMQTGDMQKKEKLFRTFLENLRKSHNPKLYSFIRLVFPNMDNQRPKCTLRTSSIATLYCTILQLGESSECFYLFFAGSF